MFPPRDRCAMSVPEPTVLGLFVCPKRTAGWDVYGTSGNGLKGKWKMTTRIAVKDARITASGLEGSDERHLATSAGSLKLTTGSHVPTADRGTAEERAVLVQSEEHVETLCRHYKYTRTGTGGDGGVWGENLMVRGLNSDNVCIGDTYEVMSNGRETGAVLQVSSPRKPCCKTAGQLNERNTGVKGQEELKAFARRTGLGGWFFRVLVPGSIHTGDVLRLKAQPHPKWKLNTLCDLMFRETTAPKDSSAGLVFWNGALEDLQELAAMKELANYEWKDSIIRYIKKGHEKVTEEWPTKQVKLSTWKGHKKLHPASRCDCASGWGWNVKTYVQEVCAVVVATVVDLTGAPDKGAAAYDKTDAHDYPHTTSPAAQSAHTPAAKRAFGGFHRPTREEGGDEKRQKRQNLHLEGAGR